jgi:predicted transglutaminase-like protease
MKTAYFLSVWFVLTSVVPINDKSHKVAKEMLLIFRIVIFSVIFSDNCCVISILYNEWAYTTNYNQFVSMTYNVVLLYLLVQLYVFPVR